MNTPIKNINIADINIAFSSKKQINGLPGEKIFNRVITYNNPDIIIEEYYPAPHDISLKYGNLVFDTRYWSFYHQNGHKVFVAKPSVLGSGAVALFDHSMTKGKIYLADPDYDWMKSWLAMAIMGNLLSLRARFIFHGCGIIDKNKGYLFLGESGAGKTNFFEEVSPFSYLLGKSITTLSSAVKLKTANLASLPAAASITAFSLFL